MTLRCPTCGETFPAGARYCDQDGTPLVATERRVPPRLGWLVLVAGVALLTLGLTLPFLVERYLVLGIHVAVEEIRVDTVVPRGPVAGSGLGAFLDELLEVPGRLLGPQRFAIDLRIENEVFTPVTVHSARYVVQVADETVASGSWEAPEGGVQFEPGQTLRIDLTVQPNHRGAASVADQLTRGRLPEVDVSGDLTVALLGVTFDLPFEVRRLTLDSPDREPDPPADTYSFPRSEFGIV